MHGTWKHTGKLCRCFWHYHQIRYTNLTIARSSPVIVVSYKEIKDYGVEGASVILERGFTLRCFSEIRWHVVLSLGITLDFILNSYKCSEAILRLDHHRDNICLGHCWHVDNYSTVFIEIISKYSKDGQRSCFKGGREPRIPPSRRNKQQNWKCDCATWVPKDDCECLAQSPITTLLEVPSVRIMVAISLKSKPSKYPTSKNSRAK